jgi:smad nuclear-interacting protein 1
MADFGLSGALNAPAGVPPGAAVGRATWNPPADADEPSPGERWLLYAYKDGEELKEGSPIPLARGTTLFGRAAGVVDVPMAHFSISGQHAAIQFRRVPLKAAPGTAAPPRTVSRPYLIDLSANGSELNGVKVEGLRYYELRSKDVLTFGASTREYVLLLDASKAR